MWLVDYGILTVVQCTHIYKLLSCATSQDKSDKYEVLQQTPPLAIPMRLFYHEEVGNIASYGMRELFVQHQNVNLYGHLENKDMRDRIMKSLFTHFFDKSLEMRTAIDSDGCVDRNADQTYHVRYSAACSSPSR